MCRAMQNPAKGVTQPEMTFSSDCTTDSASSADTELAPTPFIGIPAGSPEQIVLMAGTPPVDASALPTEHQEELKGFALNIRTCKLALQRSLDPLPESPLAYADALYPWEKVSAVSREYLLAAADLGFWADQFAPPKFHPGTINIIAYRPYLLGLLGFEAAAQGLWVDCRRLTPRLAFEGTSA